MPLTDTSPEAQRVLTEVYRRLSPGRKWYIVGEAYQTLRLLHASGVRLRNPRASDRQVLEDWIHRVLGFPELVAGETVMEEQLSGFRGAREIIRVLDRLGIPYALGGSMASSLHGVPRATQDSDITVAPFPEKVQELTRAFGTDYYVSEQAVHEAHQRRCSFNVINTRTGFKADIFVCADDGGFEEMALSRRLAVCLPDLPDEPVFALTPEDIILHKLRWYRLGDETSEQQWEDILGVARTQAGKLDDAYLDHWGREIGVTDLLARVRAI
jgi:hypothetical protein